MATEQEKRRIFINSSLQKLKEKEEKQKFEDDLSDYLERKRGPSYFYGVNDPTIDEFKEFLGEQQEKKECNKKGVQYSPKNYYEDKFSTKTLGFLSFIVKHYGWYLYIVLTVTGISALITFNSLNIQKDIFPKFFISWIVVTFIFWIIYRNSRK